MKLPDLKTLDQYKRSTLLIRFGAMGAIAFAFMTFPGAISAQAEATTLNKTVAKAKAEAEAKSADAPDASVVRAQESDSARAVREFGELLAQVATKNNVELSRLTGSSESAPVADKNNEKAEWRSTEIETSLVGTTPDLYRAVVELQTKKFAFQFTSIRIQRSDSATGATGPAQAIVRARIFSKAS